MIVELSLLFHPIWIFLLFGKVVSFLPVSDLPSSGNGEVSQEVVNSERVTCAEDEFYCVSSGKCFPMRWTCDGDEDCQDGSDEFPAHCKTRTCGPTELSCRGEVGKCVPMSWVCDNHNDCIDGSDEKNCKEEKECPVGSVVCGNGVCSQEAWKCDGQDDCGDGSDEEACGTLACSDNQIMCSSGNCVSKAWACDGDSDCHNGEDEKNCPEALYPNITNICIENEFACRDQHFCVHQDWTCDGDIDCPDGTDEDEELCDMKDKCSDNEFTCFSGQCIQGHLECSGRADCDDHSDEKECGTPEPKCNEDTQFDCGDGKMCINLEQVCDNKNDCGDWKDEPRDNCDVNECLSDNGGCDQVCINTKDSFHCKCHKGYKMRANNTCQDIDECKTVGICSQVCLNRLGGFKCDCLEGYEKEPNNHSKCKVINWHPSLIFAQKTDIRTFTLDTRILSSVLNNSRSACAVDFNFKTGKVFWSDIMEERIYSADLEPGSAREVVIADGVVTPDGLAVDWVYSHLYWTDTGTNTISLTDFKGLSTVVLVKDNIQEPRAIALHPGKGWIFWSDWGRVSKIERAGMDGSHREVILKDTVRWPNGLTVDLVLNKLYWVDAKLNTVGSSNLDGSHARIVLYSPAYLKHPFSISVFEDLMYWTEWDSQKIYQADKFTGRNLAAVTATTSIPMVVQVYHPYRQPAYPNHCQPYHGHCTHFCLPAPLISPHSHRTTCACPKEMVLQADGRSCKQKEVHKKPTTVKAEDIVHAVESREEDYYHAEAFSLVSSHSGELVGMVLGIILAVVVIASMVVFLLYRKSTLKKTITIKFNNPLFHHTQASAEGPVCLQRQTLALSNKFQNSAESF